MAIINYDTKVALNENPNVPNVNKVTADDMNNIKNAVNTNASTLNDLEDDFGYLSGYSTTERKIGYWIDGKPLYRKVVNIGALPNNDSTTFTHEIPIDMPVSCKGIAVRTSPDVARFTLPMNNTQILLNLTQIVVITTVDRSTCTGYAIVEYTKTTD